MNLSKFRTAEVANKGRFMQFRDPANDELLFDDDNVAMGLNLLGQDSQTFNKRLAKLNKARAENIRVKRGGRIEGMDPIENEDKIDLLAACVTGGHAVLDGVALDLGSQDVVKKFLTDFPCFLEQADEFVADRSNYLGN